LPDEAPSVLLVATEMLEALQARIAVLDRQVLARVKASPLARRLMTIPGVGPVMATAMGRWLRPRAPSGGD
jgi:transposase